MTDILVVVFPIGLAAGFAVGYAVRAEELEQSRIGIIAMKSTACKRDLDPKHL
jgi:dihydroorotate dehydrogenase